MRDETDVPEIDLTDPAVIGDPVGAYGQARELAPLARMPIPGLGSVWVVTRYEPAKAMLADPRFELNSASFLTPEVPEDYRPYLRTMTEQPATEHARLRRLVSPAFTPRRAATFRSRIEPIVATLLAELREHAADGVVDLVAHFAGPLPTDVICELVGVPDADRTQWRTYGAIVAAGAGTAFADALPGIVDGAVEAVARRRAEPGDDLIDDLIRYRDAHGDQLSDRELVTLVWHLVIAGQTPSNLIANSVEALLAHPDQLAALRADPSLISGAVEELIRWCGPQLLSIPRYAREDVELCDVVVRKGEAVIASLVAANRDPRVFADPDRLDVRRKPEVGHLGFAHGAHFCLGAALARVETEVALGMLLETFPELAVVEGSGRVPDPGSWRLSSLKVNL